MPDAHAKEYGASNSATWLACPGSVVLARDAVRKSSTHSRSGTATHWIAEQCLLGSTNADFWRPSVTVEGEVFEVDADRIARAQLYVDTVRDLQKSLQAELLVEQKLAYGPAIGVDDLDSAWGTGDAVLLTADEIIVIDLKDGHEDVAAEGNTQLQLYALGALERFGEFMDAKRVRVIIVQPRSSPAVKEWVIDVPALREFADRATDAVEMCETAKLADAEELPNFLIPGEKQCRWCPAAATCPKLRAVVTQTVSNMTPDPATPEEFAGLDTEICLQPPVDDEWLSVAMAKAPLVEHWLKAVRAEVESRLLAGKPVPGFKLVRGKQGNRAWADEKAAEELLRKTFRLKIEEAYDMKLISPTSAEKLLAKEAPRKWAKCQPLITRADGKPSVAPESDPREALDVRPVADDFADESPSAETFA